MVSGTRRPLNFYTLLAALILGLPIAPTPIKSALGQFAVGLPPLADVRREARRLLVAEEAMRALTLIENRLKNDPEDAGLHALRAEACYALQRFSEAVSAFEKAIELDPGLEGKMFHHGRALLALERNEEALAVFDALASRPETLLQVRGFFGIGLARAALGEDEQAKAAYQRALQLDSAFMRARYRLALIDLAESKIEAAQSALQEVLKADPLHHGAAYNLALTLGRQEQREKSERAWAQYRKILEGKQQVSLLRERLNGSPADFEILLEIAVLYQELGAHGRALDHFARSAAFRPLDPRPALGSVAALRSLGRSSDAEQLCITLLERQPSIEELRGPLVELLEARGAEAEAARWRKTGDQ